jgi:hypothetical protein
LPGVGRDRPRAQSMSHRWAFTDKNTLLRRSALGSHSLWWIAALGLGIRLVLAFALYGSTDIGFFDAIARRTIDNPLHLYAYGHLGWAYPPGYLPWLVGAAKLDDWTGLPFQGIVQLPPILADLGIAIAVRFYLGVRGASEGQQVAGFSLVMLGPVFIAISGYHGQIDSVAILPAVLALIVWEQSSGSARAWGSGALVGLGGVIKTVPLLMLLPLLTTVRSAREAAKLVAPAIGLVVLLDLPFYLAERHGFAQAISYSGATGRGGLSLVLDPGFAVARRTDLGAYWTGHANAVSNWLSTHSGALIALGLLVFVVFALRYRPAPLEATMLLWLTVFAFSPNFFLQYLIWALPFFIMAGFMWPVAALQVVMIPALIITYLHIPTSRPASTVYVVLMFGLWLFWVLALIAMARRVMRERPRSGGQPGQSPLLPASNPPVGPV